MHRSAMIGKAGERNVMKKHFVWFFLCALMLLAMGMLGGCSSAPSENEKNNVETNDASEDLSENSGENSGERGDESAATPPQSDDDGAENLPDKEEEDRMKLSFGSYNIKHGADASLDMTKLASNITEFKMDVVGLQEVDQKTTRVNGIDTMKELSDATGYEHYAFFKAISYKGGEYGVGILSKYPIVETERIALESENYEQRVLGRAAINVNGTVLQFFVTHLSYEDKEVRTKQFLQIAEVLKGYDNYVLTGDFNTSDFSEYAVLPRPDAVNKRGQALVTFPSSSSSIDNIVYARDAWEFDLPKTVKQSYSDHCALYATGTYLKKSQ